MDDTLLFISYFYILISYGLTDGQTYIDTCYVAIATEKVWKFFNFSTADLSLASFHWMRPDLDAPGCCLFLDDLILIVLRIQQIH